MRPLVGVGRVRATRRVGSQGSYVTEDARPYSSNTAIRKVCFPSRGVTSMDDRHGGENAGAPKPRRADGFQKLTSVISGRAERNRYYSVSVMATVPETGGAKSMRCGGFVRPSAHTRRRPAAGLRRRIP